MNCDLAIDSKAPILPKFALLPALCVLSVLLIFLGCSEGEKKKPGRSVLTTRSGETGIQVTESDEDGTQVIRVKTTYQGEVSEIVLAVDQAVYEIDIPLSIQQVRPSIAGGGTSKDQFQDLLIAQYLEKAQVAMLNGNYNEALRQVNLVLMVRPDHLKSHEMKGSIYYAMGSYQLANEEWEQVLALDPSNQEVRDFLEFNKNRRASNRPPLPGGLQSGGTPAPGKSAPGSPTLPGAPPQQAPGGRQ